MQTTVRIQGLARAFDKIVKNADILIYCIAYMGYTYIYLDMLDDTY